MKNFNSITFSTLSTRDFDVESRFSDIVDFLEDTFNNDFEAMESCRDNYIARLDAGDSEAEKGNHQWAGVEMKANQIAFDGADWLFYQNSPSLEIHF